MSRPTACRVRSAQVSNWLEKIARPSAWHKNNVHLGDREASVGLAVLCWRRRFLRAYVFAAAHPKRMARLASA